MKVTRTAQSQKEADGSEPNKPRNHVIKDATQPFTFTYKQYGKSESIVVNQTTAEETWPGGALWDIGVLLSHVVVGLAGSDASRTKLPLRLLQAVPSTKDLSVLELGCGVGLTGIVAAAALGTQLTILTDLQPVIEQVAIPNLLQNSTPGQSPFRFTQAGKRGKIMAMPLCWGDSNDEQAVADMFSKTIKPVKSSPRKKKRAAESCEGRFKA